MTEIGYAGALLGGVLTLLSPCSAVLLPSFFAYAFTTRSALLGRTMVFYLGLLTTLVPLGVAASSVGALFTQHRELLIAVLSGVVIVLGVLQVLGISLPSLRRAGGGPSSDTGGVVSVYLLGTVYGVAGVCSGPILGSVLVVAGLGSDALYGGALLAVYALGMVVPLAVLALLWDRFELASRRWLKPRIVSLGRIRTTSTGLVSGALFVAIGVLLLLTEGTANLGGVLGVDAQYDTELGVQQFAAQVPDTVVAVALVAVVLGVVSWWRHRSISHQADTLDSTRFEGTPAPGTDAGTATGTREHRDGR